MDSFGGSFGQWSPNNEEDDLTLRILSISLWRVLLGQSLVISLGRAFWATEPCVSGSGDHTMAFLNSDLAESHKV